MNFPSVRPHKPYKTSSFFAFCQNSIYVVESTGGSTLTRALADTQKSLRLTKMKNERMYPKYSLAGRCHPIKYGTQETK